MPGDPLSRLPHAHPFRFVDRVIDIDPGHRALAVRLVTATDPSLAASGYLPTVVLAEAMAQVAGLAAAGTRGELAVIAQMARFRFRLGARVGDELTIDARVQRRFGGFVKVRALVRAGTRRCAAGEIVLSFTRGAEGGR